MEAIVEKIEKGILILELDSENKIEFPQKFLSDAKEGDVITFFVNKDKTESRKRELTERMNRLWKD